MNPVESWNKWMVELRQMSIPMLVTSYLQKLWLKIDMRNVEV